MIQSKTILKALPKVLKTINIPSLGKKYQGKVRDIYLKDDKRILITTDRQSAFDVILGCIPFKGTVLNLLSKFWFEKTRHIIANHMVSVPDSNVMVTRNCRPTSIEMIVRGYMTGVTKTSIWYSYQKGERIIYGIKFPDGMKKNQKLDRPVLTPTTHPEVGSKLHDERLTRDEILRNKIVDKKIFLQMEEAALKLFEFGSSWCRKKGLILVDTKYEFGIYDGKLMLIDEIHTPDSSRFWTRDSYDRIFSADYKDGEPQTRLTSSRGLRPRVGGASVRGEPENFDKEFLRLGYADKGYRGDGKPPAMSKQLIVDLAKRYIGVYEKITGTKFKAYKYPITDRIKKNIEKAIKL